MVVDSDKMGLCYLISIYRNESSNNSFDGTGQPHRQRGTRAYPVGLVRLPSISLISKSDTRWLFDV